MCCAERSIRGKDSEKTKHENGLSLLHALLDHTCDPSFQDYWNSFRHVLGLWGFGNKKWPRQTTLSSSRFGARTCHTYIRYCPDIRQRHATSPGYMVDQSSETNHPPSIRRYGVCMTCCPSTSGIWGVQGLTDYTVSFRGCIGIQAHRYVWFW
jgi:hypothetical protein